MKPSDKVAERGPTSAAFAERGALRRQIRPQFQSKNCDDLLGQLRKIQWRDLLGCAKMEEGKKRKERPRCLPTAK